MDKASEFSCLPREILSKIFRYLSYLDLANVLIVSRMWKNVAEDPWLWKDFHLNVNNSELLLKLVQMSRFSCVRTIQIGAGFVTSNEEAEYLFSYIGKHRCLKDLNLCYNNIKSVSPRILATCFNKLEKVQNVELSDSQVLELFTFISVKTNLKELEICSTNFEKVPEEIFSKAIYKLDRLNLTFSILTKQQVETMFKAITEDTKENDLDIAGTANLYKMNVAGFAPYVLGFAPYERRAKKLLRITKGKHCRKFLRKHIGSSHLAKRKKEKMQAMLQAMKVA